MKRRHAWLALNWRLRHIFTFSGLFVVVNKQWYCVYIVGPKDGILVGVKTLGRSKRNCITVTEGGNYAVPSQMLWQISWKGKRRHWTLCRQSTKDTHNSQTQMKVGCGCHAGFLSFLSFFSVSVCSRRRRCSQGRWGRNRPPALWTWSWNQSCLSILSKELNCIAPRA